MTDRQHAATLANALRQVIGAYEGNLTSRATDDAIPEALDALAAWDRHHSAQPDQQRALDL